MATDPGDRTTATGRDGDVVERPRARRTTSPPARKPGPAQDQPVSQQAVAAPPRQRVPWGSLSRGQVVDAATAIVEAGGFETMTIRSLAAELGVAPMSLYRHVRDKDDLLDEVVDRLLAATWRPEAPTGDWRAWMVEVADRLRALLVSQPAALQAFLRHPVVSPAAIARMETVLAVLSGAGVPDAEAWQAFATVQTYTVGFAALEASRAGWSSSKGPSEGLVGRLASITTPHQFVEGLGWLLDALERHLEQPASEKRRHGPAREVAGRPGRPHRGR